LEYCADKVAKTMSGEQLANVYDKNAKTVVLAIAFVADVGKQ
jgi:hypothetical protein